ncbi:conserved hypothetical protein [Culex quinquefasciatus]|uniref:Ribosome inactivating protein n=1 Tax=Culex quinquefasciatus TaxID=7176 RepID=B0WQ89_CULQU|nr:conserved hypothetical protein [Culex quinquefasciatus]|eukprot:XP_001850873.1 conserved hypothetical protein [Culex quinquefasciatus]
MQFNRAKRATTTVRTGNIDDFKKNGQNYLTFIDSLRGDLSQPNVAHGGIRVTKTDNGITKVILKSGTTQIPFIYRNSDLYIVGFVVGSVFYADNDVFKWISPRETVGKLPAKHAWRSVLGDVTVDTLSVPLSYNNILQGRSKVPINKMGDSLKKLTEVGDRNKKSAIVKEHLVPFVVAFSEAIRFTVVARAVRDAFVKNGGELDMKTNVLKLAGAGGPDQRKSTRYDITWLTLNWGSLSEKVKVCYLDKQAPTPFKYCDEPLGLEKNQLNQLLGVATARSFPASRGKREVQWFKQPVQQVVDPVGRIGAEGDLQEASSSKPMSAITHHLDMVGSLHLITMGILYLSGRKLQAFEHEREVDGQEAQAIAADLVEKINCVTGLDSDYEEDMRMQRELYGAIVRGADVVQIMTGLVEQRIEKRKVVEEAVKSISFELAKRNHLEIPQEAELFAKNCF